MDKIFIDTDLLIDFTFQKNKILYTLIEKQKEKKVELFINPIVTAEFLTDKYLLHKEKLEGAYHFLGSFHLLEINANIGFLAGQLLREGKTPFISDAFIAATCLTYTLSLATRNKKHFKKVPHLRLYSQMILT